MTWQDYVALILGAVCIAIGLAYFLSPRFAQIAFASTSQGVFWKSIVGERWAPLLAKYVFAFVSIAFGVWVLYSTLMKV